MFQHYILFRGRKPYEHVNQGYSTIDEKAEDEEKAPLLDDKDDAKTIQEGDCSAVSLSKRFKRLLRLA